METSLLSGSPLRHRMQEDMRMDKLKPKTREAYIRAVRKFSKFLDRRVEPGRYRLNDSQFATPFG